ncbi:MAG: hypothetical protein M3220_10475 [Chloroflexota bacterium]|nr:hypothetical protein [Chloroflexota bacterium]
MGGPTRHSLRSDDGGGLYLVSNAYRDGSAPWTESRLTWDNAPALFNHPGYLDRVALGAVEGNNQGVSCSETDCTGLVDDPTLGKPRCDASSASDPRWFSVHDRGHGMWECKGWFPMTIDTNNYTDGLKEFRSKPDTDHPDLGTRLFTTNNAQIYIKNGKTDDSNYRSSPGFIARGWYTDLEYANVSWEKYIDLVGVHESIPTVRGVLTFRVKHSKCSGTQNESLGFVDPDFHIAKYLVNVQN